uniref:Pre-rRNA-processing protein TSR2 homolog n=1 Tax=Hemiscolopendra marginata TaxID=943146 RepID=A0A646QIK3_9MYRI
MSAVEEKSLFHKIVEKYVITWPALNLALQNGMGGMQAREKVDWMISVINQFYLDNENLEPYEVEHFIAELLDNEFDTIVDDGSLEQMSVNLCNYFRQCQTSMIADLSTVANWPTDGTFSKHTAKNEAQLSEGTTVTRQMNSLTLDTNEMEKDEDEADDNGWTVVHHRRR